MSPGSASPATGGDVVVTGIDLASQPAGTGIARLRLDRDRAVVEEVAVGGDDDHVLAAVTGSEHSGVDVPFGWPAPFADLIAAHRTATAPVSSAVGPSWHQPLTWRATDAYVHQRTGLRPLSVSTDKIAYPALRWAHLAAALHRHGVDVTRDGSGAVCEVYPAAALYRWGLPHRGYKKAAGRPVRAAIIEGLQGLMPHLEWNGHQEACLAVDDALDAVLCALIAAAVYAGDYEPPPAHLRALAAEEGWICLPTEPVPGAGRERR